MPTSSRPKGATSKRDHRVGLSFSNWIMGGPLISLSTTSSLGRRLTSKGSHKNIDIDTDDEEPPDPTPPAPVKVPKKVKVPKPEPKTTEEKKFVCADCGPEPDNAECAPDCSICKEECLWEKHMLEKFGSIECDTCGRGSTWLKDEFHKGHGEYACEKCMPDCTACGRGPLWLSKKWKKTLKRRSKKMQGLKKDKKDGDGNKDKGDDSEKNTNESDGEKSKGKEKEKEKDKREKEKQTGNREEKEDDKEDDKPAEKNKDSSANNNASSKDTSEKKDEGKGKKRGHEWTSEQDAKLKEMKAQQISWKDIASKLGVNQGLCKGRFKVIENTTDATTEKKDESSSGDKAKTSGGDGDVLGGFGDWDNEDSNKKTDTWGAKDNNDGWGAIDTLEDNAGGAADNGWGSNDNTNADVNNGDSGWGNNDSSKDTSGDTGAQTWDDPFNANANTKDSGKSTWDNDNSNKSGNDSSGNKDKQNGGGKKKSRNVNWEKDKPLEGQNTESTPAAFVDIPYKPYVSAFATGSGDINFNTGTADHFPAQASGGLEPLGGGWDAGTSWNAAPDTPHKSTGNGETSDNGWFTVDPSNDKAANEPVRDCWAQPKLPKESDNAGAADSSNKPATSDNGWVDVNESSLGFGKDINAGAGWRKNQYGDAARASNKADTANQNTGNGGQSGDQGRNNSNNNTGNTSWDESGPTKNQNSANAGNYWGQGGADTSNNNNAGSFVNRPNSWNNQNSGSNGFNQGNNGGGGGGGGTNGSNNFNSGGFNQESNNNGGGGGSNGSNNFNPGVFNQENKNLNNLNSNNNNNNRSGGDRGTQSRGRLRPTGIWTQADCTFLEFLETKYREHKWALMQADFYNWGKRMVPAELIEQKFKDDGYFK